MKNGRTRIPRATFRTCFVVTRVLDEVCLENSHEDSGQESRQQQHSHARVDDAEPVDLRNIAPTLSNNPENPLQRPLRLLVQ